jgi:outer membrane protein insertion porin family
MRRLTEPHVNQLIQFRAICSRRVVFLLALFLLSINLFAQQTSLPINGVHWFSEQFVRDIFRDRSLESGRDSLYAAYASAGFLNASVSADSASGISVVEGARFRIADLAVIPDSAAVLVRHAQSFPGDLAGQYFTTAIVDDALHRLVAALNSEGYPLASARLAAMNVSDSAAEVRLTFELQPGERVTISEIDVRGNTETSRDLIVTAAAVPRGQTFTDELARQVRARLIRLNVFSEVDEPQLYRTANGSYGLLLTVKEGSANTFDGILGYQPPGSGDTSQSGSLTGHLNFVLRNIFGTGRRIAVLFDKSKPSQQLEVRYGEPFILDLPLDAEVGYKLRQEALTSALPSYVQRALSADLYYGFVDAWSLRFGGAYEETIPELDSTRPCDQQLLNSSTLQTTIGVTGDSRSNPVNPVHGARFVTSVTVGTKKIRGVATCADSLVPPSEFRQQIEADLDAYMTIYGPFVLAAGVHGGIIRGSFLEESDLFRFGGQSSVRGYLENQFRASQRMSGTIEARVILAQTSYAALFFDGGYFLHPEDILRNASAFDQWIFGYGISAQIASPLGLIRLSFALSREDTFETGKVFLGLVNQF